MNYTKYTLVTKILLDITMFILYLILMFGYGMNPLFHELAGIGMVVLYALHLYFNKSWIRTNLKGKSRNKKNRYNKITDIVLALGMLTVIMTGVLIAKYAVLIDVGLLRIVLYKVHKISSCLCLGILLVHVGLHTKYLVGAIKHIYTNKRAVYVRRVLAGFMCLCMVTYFIYAQIQVAFDKKQMVTTDIEQEGESLDNANNPPESLEDYLGGLTCRGCVKSCSLLALQCHSGDREVETFTEKYYELYENS